MPILHHLARTGGTLISRCLGSMDGVCLLSEISHLGTSHVNPLQQAADWYGLVQVDEVRELPDEQALPSAILLIFTSGPRFRRNEAVNTQASRSKRPD